MNQYAKRATDHPIQPGDYVKVVTPTGNVVSGRVMQIQGWSVDVLWQNHQRSWIPYAQLSHLESKKGLAASKLLSAIGILTGSAAIFEAGIKGRSADGDTLTALLITTVLCGVLGLVSRRSGRTYTAAAIAAFAVFVVWAVATRLW